MEKTNFEVMNFSINDGEDEGTWTSNCERVGGCKKTWNRNPVFNKKMNNNTFEWSEQEWQDTRMRSIYSSPHRERIRQNLV